MKIITQKCFIKMLVLFLLISPIIIAQNVVTNNGLLEVSGNRIINKSGEIYSVAGNSIFWSGFLNDGGKFYQTSVVDHLANDFKSGIVRAAMAVEEADGSNVSPFDSSFPGALVKNPNAQGYFNNPEREMARIKTVIDAAIANDIYVIVDFHSHFAHFFKDEAIQFFTDIATEYGNNEHIIYEIFNEPIGLADFRNTQNDSAAFNQFDQTWSQIIKPYAIDVINAIRAIDPDNLIIVGTPGFSQGVEVASNNPITTANLNLPSGAKLNLAYTLHFYAATHKDGLRNAAQRAIDNGIALFVTEWGIVEASGTGPVDLPETFKWLEFMNTNQISHANWSVSDKGGDTSSLVRGGFGVDGLLANQLTPAGNFIKCMVQNWNEGTDFTTCTTEGDGGGPTDGVTFPVGVGTKVKASLSNWQSPGITGQVIGNELVYTGFTTGEAIAFSLNDIDVSQSYTVQVVVSSETSGNTLKLQRGAGTVELGDLSVPNTGKDIYTLINASGVTFTADDKTIAIAAEGTGTFNVESFYITNDDNPILGVPSFDPALANSINIGPIPATNSLFINTDKVLDIKYSIFDISGKELVSKNEYNDVINVSNLTNGIYLMKLFINNQNQTYKFIKE